MKQQYDVVVIGAGSGGLTAAVGFTKIGKTVLLVEREHMGGECTNTGCIPSKALLHRAREYYIAKTISGETSQNDSYRDGALTYVRNTIEAILEEETPETFKALGIDVVIGEAEFVSKCAVKVGDTTYSYKKAVIATGSSPRTLDVPGLDETHVLTNQNIFSLERIPEKTLVIGAGPIGLEMGQALSMLGSDVTIATIDSEFARLEDTAVRPILKRAFIELGITIHQSAFINRVEGDTAYFDIKNKDGVVEREQSVAFDKVLIAIGRVPNLPAGLKAAGITYDERCIMVDSQHRTSNKYVYAVGDVAQRLKFTHTADDSARQVVARVASKGLLRVNKKKAVPKVTYTAPEVAQVGMSYEQAIARYTEDSIMRIEVPFSNNDRAKTDDTTDGVLVVVARRLNGAVLGAHIIGPAAGELIALFTLAIDQKISLWKLQKLIYAYPTYALIVKKAGDQFVAKQIGNLKSDLFGLLIRNSSSIGAAIIWIAGLVALQQYQTSTGLTATELSVSLFGFITMTAWGPLVYVLLYAIRPITFFPATALTILSGIFFGFVWGTILTVIAATLAAAVAYGVGRFFGKNLALEHTVIGNWVSALRSNTFSAVLTTRLIFLPFDLISYAAGILRVNFLPFVTATFLGIILGTATFVSIGSSLNVQEFIENGFSFSILEPQFLALSVGIFVFSVGLSKVMKRWRAEM